MFAMMLVLVLNVKISGLGIVDVRPWRGGQFLLPSPTIPPLLLAITHFQKSFGRSTSFLLQWHVATGIWSYSRLCYCNVNICCTVSLCKFEFGNCHFRVDHHQLKRLSHFSIFSFTRSREISTTFMIRGPRKSAGYVLLEPEGRLDTADNWNWT